MVNLSKNLLHYRIKRGNIHTSADNTDRRNMINH
nr:MAG TPA: hypothetical protein [Caudoviricetes sp.]DAP88312.1 MAG TPA: hypothetical protein [Caudoviricetes sp.]